MAKRILIVEDERDVAMLLRNYLEFKGYEVEEAHSGADALKRIFKGGYDLVLLDYGMRDIKGDRLCQMARAEGATSKLPMIIVTAHVEVDDNLFKQWGATDVIYKPVNTDELYSKVEKHLKQ